MQAGNWEEGLKRSGGKQGKTETHVSQHLPHEWRQGGAFATEMHTVLTPRMWGSQQRRRPKCSPTPALGATAEGQGAWAAQCLAPCADLQSVKTGCSLISTSKTLYISLVPKSNQEPHKGIVWERDSGNYSSSLVNWVQYRVTKKGSLDFRQVQVCEVDWTDSRKYGLSMISYTQPWLG